jgi:hypothetical protein
MTDPAHDLGAGSGTAQAATAEQVRELAEQLATLQIQTHSVLSQLSAIASRLTTVEDRAEDMGAAMDAVEALLATTAIPSTAAAELAHDTALDTAGGAVGGAVDGSVGGPPGVELAADDVDVGLDLRRLVAWVRDNVALLLERKMPQTQGGLHWCRQWWQHPEAIARFEAVRRCWAEAVTSGDGAGMAVWFEHLDHHLAVLTGEMGPFAHCGRGVHAPGRATPLGHDEPSERYFLDFDAIIDALAS